MARPCDEGKRCTYAVYDEFENCEICAIDFSGDNCPYIKPWGKKRYKEEQLKEEIYGKS